MVHALWRHRDHVNYNGPKVSSTLAPAIRKGGACIWLNAGIPGESDGTQNMSDNPIGAGNQQESLSPEWVVGFVDGEGCFYVGVNRQPSMKLGRQVLPEFRVVKHERDVALLEQLREFFGAVRSP